MVVIIRRSLLHFVLPKRRWHFVEVARGIRELDQIRSAGFDRLRDGACDEVFTVITDGS
jgi:hypothetical protein